MSRVFEKIIVGCNGAQESERAVEVAVSLAEGIGAKIILLGVVPPPAPETEAQGVKQRLNVQLVRLLESAKARGVDAVAAIVEGDPEHQLEKHANEEGADLIVVGHRNVSRLRHWLERSTSEGLLHHAKTSILVVHNPVART